MRAPRILRLDVSETALATARSRVPNAEFRVLPAERVGELSEHFDLAVCLEMLSFVADWRSFLDELAAVADWLCLTLYLPPDPGWHVKTFDELRTELHVRWRPAVEMTVEQQTVDGAQLMMLAAPRS